MNARWNHVKFADAPVEIIDGDRGKNYPKQSDFYDSGYCLFLNTGNVTTNGFDFSRCQFIAEEKDVALRKGKLAREDVVMTTRGTIGNVAYFDGTVPFDHIRINSGMVIFRSNRDQVKPRFLYCYLRSADFQAQVNAVRSGVAQPQLPIRDIKTISIPLPPIDEQERIAGILSSYDDLIENNLRRIELLEKTARLLYEEWFVRLRFPGYEHTKTKDGVPEGWGKNRLIELANLTMGQSPESKFYNKEGDGLPFHQGVSDFGERFITHKVFCTVQARIAHPGDILCSVRAPVGRLNITLDKIVIGRGLAAIRSKTGNQSFLYYQLKSHFFKEDMIGSGAIFAAVTKKDMENQELLTPPQSLIQSFEDLSRSIDKQIQTLFLQNQKLKQARDLLLPRLMNGEILV
jgi:type I restriction enzyme S subunit